MLVYELEKQMPELNKLGCSQIEEFLQKNSIPFRNPIIGSVTINDSDAEKALTIYHALLAKKNFSTKRFSIFIMWKLMTPPKIKEKENA